MFPVSRPIRFNRSQLFWYGVALIFSVFASYKCFLLLTWEHTNGLVAGYDVKLPNGQTIRLMPHQTRSGMSSKWNVVAFYANGSMHHFVAGENLDLPINKEVRVIHSKQVPSKAFVNSFFGLWFRPLMVLPVIIWAVIVMGLTGKNSVWNVRLRPFRVSRIDIQRRSAGE